VLADFRAVRGVPWISVDFLGVPWNAMALTILGLAAVKHSLGALSREEVLRYFSQEIWINILSSQTGYQGGGRAHAGSLSGFWLGTTREQTRFAPFLLASARACSIVRNSAGLGPPKRDDTSSPCRGKLSRG
jgi:hypothetical protein